MGSPQFEENVSNSQPNRPIGGATAKKKNAKVLITPKPLVVDSNFNIFGILGSGKIEKPPCDLGSTGPPFFANLSDIRNVLLRTSPRFLPDRIQTTAEMFSGK